MPRHELVRKYLDTILARKGVMLTLGILMGIIIRLAEQDYDLVKELEARAKDDRN